MKKAFPFRMQVLMAAAIGLVAVVAILGVSPLRQLVGLEAGGNPATAQRPGRPAVPVIISPVTELRDTLVYETVGTGVASRSVMLRSEVDGIVTRSMLAPGEHFKAGDLLLTLNDRDQQLALKLAETRLAQAERDRERLANLRERGITPETVFREAVTAAELAQLELERARNEVEERSLRAPFDGVSGLPLVEPGDRVEPGMELASFDDRETLKVEFDLPETLLTRIGTGDKIDAASASLPGRKLTGTIVSIDSRIDPAKRAAKVQVEIPNEEDLLRPGASFTLVLELKGPMYPSVPELGLQFSSGSLYVWRIIDEKAERVEVELVRRREGRILVDGPLAEGDDVVVEGTQRLSPGRAVNVLGAQKAGS